MIDPTYAAVRTGTDISFVLLAGGVNVDRNNQSFRFSQDWEETWMVEKLTISHPGPYSRFESQLGNATLEFLDGGLRIFHRKLRKTGKTNWMRPDRLTRDVIAFTAQRGDGLFVQLFSACQPHGYVTTNLFAWTSVPMNRRRSVVTARATVQTNHAVTISVRRMGHRAFDSLEAGGATTVTDESRLEAVTRTLGKPADRMAQDAHASSERANLRSDESTLTAD